MEGELGKWVAVAHEAASLLAAVAALIVSIRSGRIAKQAAQSAAAAQTAAANAHEAAKEAVKEQINFALRNVARDRAALGAVTSDEGAFRSGEMGIGYPQNVGGVKE